MSEQKSILIRMTGDLHRKIKILSAETGKSINDYVVDYFNSLVKNQPIIKESDKLLIESLERLPESFWDFKSADTRNYTHGIHNYPAVMVSPISESIISIVKNIKPITSVFDPFIGSGSVAIEAIRANINNVYGIDLNPLAFLLSKVRTTYLNDSQINFLNSFYIIINNLYLNDNDDKEFEDFITKTLSLDITSKSGWGNQAVEYIDEFLETKKIYSDYPRENNIGFWFKPSVVVQLIKIKNQINKIKDETIKDFLKITFSETVRSSSNTRNSEFKLYRMTEDKILSANLNAYDIFIKILQNNIMKIVDYSNYIKVNNITSTSEIIYGSAMDKDVLSKIEDHSVDLVITSPPYGDSSTTVAYGQFSKLSLQWIDLDEFDPNIKNIDKLLLGGTIYKEMGWGELQSPTLNEALTKIAKSDINRAMEVYSFYKDLDTCIANVNLKMRNGGYQFWVVGNRTVKMVNLRTDLIVSELSEKYGARLIYTFDRTISNKTMPSLNSPTNETGKKVKTMTSEIIVVLKNF